MCTSSTAQHSKTYDSVNFVKLDANNFRTYYGKIQNLQIKTTV